MTTQKIVEQQKMLEKTMEAYRIAYTDPLTNTQNRLSYIERLNDVQRNIAAYKAVDVYKRQPLYLPGNSFNPVVLFAP